MADGAYRHGATGRNVTTFAEDPGLGAESSWPAWLVRLRARLRLLGEVCAWATGAHLPTVRESDSARPFYTALGACVLIFSCLNGLLFTLAAAYATRQPHPAHLWWLGLLWIGVMLSIERLILQISSGRLLPVLAASIPRVTVSVLIALVVSEVAGLAFYKPEIRSYLSKQQAQQLAQVNHDVDRIYAGKIEQNKNDIARLSANVRKVEERIAREDLHAQQRVDATGYCTTRCRYYRELARGDRQQLAAMQARNRPRFANDRAENRQLAGQRAQTLHERRSSVIEQDGLLARTHALSEIQRRDSSVNTRVWEILLLLFAIDLTPFAAKLVYLLTVKDGSYEKNLAGRRAAEGLAGDQRMEWARSQRSRFKTEGRAARRRSQWEAEGEEFSRYGDVYDSPASDEFVPEVESFDLTEYTERMQDWEHRPVVVPPVLRRGGLVGIALLAATLVVSLLVDARGGLLFGALVLAALGLLIRTRGFRVAPAWALRAIFAALVLGLIAPFALLILDA